MNIDAVQAKELDHLLCELYAYVDEHRARKERDWDIFLETYYTEVGPVAPEENALKDRILYGLKIVREIREAN